MAHSSIPELQAKAGWVSDLVKTDPTFVCFVRADSSSFPSSRPAFVFFSEDIMPDASRAGAFCMHQYTR